MKYLGDTLEEIAREKAGIAKPGAPFVVGETRSGAGGGAAAGSDRLGPVTRSRVPTPTSGCVPAGATI